MASFFHWAKNGAQRRYLLLHYVSPLPAPSQPSPSLRPVPGTKGLKPRTQEEEHLDERQLQTERRARIRKLRKSKRVLGTPRNQGTPELCPKKNFPLISSSFQSGCHSNTRAWEVKEQVLRSPKGSVNWCPASTHMYTLTGTHVYTYTHKNTQAHSYMPHIHI